MESLKDGRARPSSGTTPGLEMTMSLSGPPGFNHQHTTVPTDSLYHYMNRLQQSTQQHQHPQPQTRPRSGSNSSGSRSGGSSDHRAITTDNRCGGGGPGTEAPMPHLDSRLINHESLSRASKESNQHGIAHTTSSSRSHPSHPPPPLHHDGDAHVIHHQMASSKDGQSQALHERHYSQHHNAVQVPQHMASLEHVPQHQQQHHHPQQQHHHSQPSQTLMSQHQPHSHHSRHYLDQRTMLAQDGRSSNTDTRLNRDSSGSALSSSKFPATPDPPPKDNQSNISHHDHLHALYNTLQQTSYRNQHVQPVVSAAATSKPMLSPHYLPGKQTPSVSVASSLTHTVGLSPNANFGMLPLATKLPASTADTQGVSSISHPSSSSSHTELSHPYLGAKGASILHPEDHHRLMMASVGHYQMDMTKIESQALMQQQHQQQQRHLANESGREQKMEYRDLHNYPGSSRNSFSNSKSSQGIQGHNRLSEHVLPSPDGRSERHSSDPQRHLIPISSVTVGHSTAVVNKKPSIYPDYPPLIQAADYPLSSSTNAYRGNGPPASSSPHHMVGVNPATHHVSQDLQHGHYNASGSQHLPKPHGKSQSVIKHQSLGFEERSDWRTGGTSNKHIISPVSEESLNSRSVTPKGTVSSHLHVSSHPRSLHTPVPAVIQGSISIGQPRVLYDSSSGKTTGHRPSSSERYNTSVDRRQIDSHQYSPARPPHNISTSEEPTSKQQQPDKQPMRATGTPLDLTKLNQVPAKSLDTPLDLTVKTKKRPSDTSLERSTPEFDRMLSASKRPKLENRSSQGVSSLMPMNSSELFQNSVWITPTASPRSIENFDHRTQASPAYSSHTPSPAGLKSSQPNNGRASSDGRYLLDVRASSDSHVSNINGRTNPDVFLNSQGGVKCGKSTSTALTDTMKSATSNPQMVSLTTQLQKVKEEQAYQMKLNQRLTADPTSHPYDPKKSHRDGGSHVEPSSGNNSEMVVVRHQQQMPHLLSQAEYEQQQHAQLIQQQQQHQHHHQQQTAQRQMMQPLHVDSRHPHHGLSQQQQIMLTSKPCPGSKSQQEIIELGMKDSSDPLQASRTIHATSEPELYVTAGQIEIQKQQRVYVNHQLHPKKEQLSPFSQTVQTYSKSVANPSNQSLYGKHCVPSSQQYSPNTHNYPGKREDLERYYQKQQQQQLQLQQHHHQKQHQQQIIDAKSRTHQSSEPYKHALAMPALSPSQKWASATQQRPSLSRKEHSSLYNHIPDFSSKDITSRHKHYSQSQLMNIHQSGRDPANIKYGFLKPGQVGLVPDPLKVSSLSQQMPCTLPAGGVREESRRALPAGGVREESRRALSRRTSYAEGSSYSQAAVADPGRMPELIRRKESSSSLPERNSRPEMGIMKMDSGPTQAGSFLLKERGNDVILKQSSSGDGEASKRERHQHSLSMAAPVSTVPVPPRQGDDKTNPIDITKVQSPSPFSSPLTVTIPQSPVTIPSPAMSPLQPVSASTSASSTPTPMQSAPPNASSSRPAATSAAISSSHKAWSRKHMILNAVNQDESLKRIISNNGSKHEPGGISVECKSRIMAASSTGSPVPASPKMPILSPHEDEGEVVREEQRVTTPADEDDPPPTLDPIKGRHGKPASSRVFSHGQLPPSQSGNNNSNNSNQTAGAENPLVNNNTANNNNNKAVPDTSPKKALDENTDEPSINSVIVRRCSLGTAPSESSQQPAVDETVSKLSSGNTAFPRSEVIRRNSLTSHALNDRPWGHMKNIPIANVAPFVHSRSDDEKGKNRQTQDRRSNNSSGNNTAGNNVNSPALDTTNSTTNNTSSGRGGSPQSRTTISPMNKNISNENSTPEDNPQSPAPIKSKNNESSEDVDAKIEKDGKSETFSSVLASSSKKVLCSKKKKVAKLRVSSPTKMKELELISPNLEYTVLKSSQMDDLRAIERLSQGGEKKLLRNRLKRKHKIVKERNVLKVKKVPRKRIRYAFREGDDDDEDGDDDDDVNTMKERGKRDYSTVEEDDEEEKDDDDDDDDEEDEGRVKKRSSCKKDAETKARDREERALRRGQLRDQSSDDAPSARAPVCRASRRESSTSSRTVARSGKNGTCNKATRQASRITRRRISSTNQKAQELKHNALVQQRLTGKRTIRHYNRNSTHEPELHRESNRHVVVRAKRQASSRARERLQQHRENLQEGDDAVDDDNDNGTEGDETWEAPETRGARKVGHGHSGSGNNTKGVAGSGGAKTTSPNNVGKTSHSTVPSSKHTPVPSTSSSSGRKEDYESDVEDVPDDIAEEMAASKGRRKTKGKNKTNKQRDRTSVGAGGDNEGQSNSGTATQEGGDGVDESIYTSCPVTSTPKIPIENVAIPADVKKLSINKNSGETLLHRAARLGHEEITLYCLKTQSVPVNARDNAGYTPLHEGCVRGSLTVARHLIYYGADVNCCSQDGIRPIHDAIENDHLEVVRLLLTHGADPLIATYAGRTPVRIANSLAMLQTLQGHIADVNGWMTYEENEEEEEERRPVELPWRFTSSLAFYDNVLECGGYSPWVDMPEDPADDSSDVFDDGGTSAVNVFNLALEGEDRTPQPFCLLDDVMHRLNLHKDKLKLLHPWEESSITLSSERVREVASCCCSNVSIRLPQSGSVTLLPFSTLKGIELALVKKSKQKEVKIKEVKDKLISSKDYKGNIVKKDEDYSSLGSKGGHRNLEKCSPLEKGFGGICLKEGEKKHTSSKSKKGSASQGSSLSSSCSLLLSSPLLATTSSSSLQTGSTGIGSAIKDGSGKPSLSTLKLATPTSHLSTTPIKSSLSASFHMSFSQTFDQADCCDKKSSDSSYGNESKQDQSQHHGHHRQQQQHIHKQPQQQTQLLSSPSLQKQHYSQYQQQIQEKRPHTTHTSYPAHSTSSLSLSLSSTTSPASTMSYSHKSNRLHSDFLSSNSTATSGATNILMKNNNNNTSSKNKNDVSTTSTTTNNSSFSSKHSNGSTEAVGGAHLISRKTKKETTADNDWSSNPMFSDDSSSSPFHSATINCFDSDNSP